MTLPSKIKEGLLEGGRVILLAVVSWLLTVGVVANVVAALVGAHIDPTTQLVIVGLITSALRAIDKWLHESGKETNNTSLLGTKGLTGF